MNVSGVRPGPGFYESWAGSFLNQKEKENVQMSDYKSKDFFFAE